MKKVVLIIILLSLVFLVTFLVKSKSKYYQLDKEVYKLYLESGDITDKYSSLSVGDKRIKGFIKWHGNSAKILEKKSYTIKFKKKQKLFNLGSSKKYILVSNGYDDTLIRNKIVYDFSYNTRLKYKTKSVLVDLYINNMYQGLYLLTRKVKVDLKKEDYLLEYEKERDDGKRYVVSKKYNYRFRVKSKKDDRKLYSYLDELESALKKRDYKLISKYVDINSMVDSYIIEEYFKDADCNYSSLYFYFHKDKLYAGPIWDFDLSLGFNLIDEFYDLYNNRNGMGTKSEDSSEGLYCNKGIYGKLLSYKPFKKKVIKRFKELKPKIQYLYNQRIYDYYELYKGSVRRNACLYHLKECRKVDYKENIDYLHKWLKRREKWLEKNLE